MPSAVQIEVSRLPSSDMRLTGTEECSSARPLMPYLDGLAAGPRHGNHEVPALEGDEGARAVRREADLVGGGRVVPGPDPVTRRCVRRS